MSGTRDAGNMLDPPIGGRLAGGEQSEFELLYFEHYANVLRLIARLTGERAQAEELANEVFWRLSRRPLSWLLSGNVGPWLYRTAANIGIDAYRASSKCARYERGASQEAPANLSQTGALDDLLREEERRRVRQVLCEMKPAQAQLLTLRSCGSSYRELAQALGVSAGSVGTLLNRAEEEFRKRYLRLMAKEGEK